MVTLGRNILGCADVAAVARARVVVAVAAEGMTRAAAAHRAAVAAQGPIYGRTTGVGANGAVPVEYVPGNGLRLMRSHASGGGEPVSDEVARAMLAVRLNQLAAGGSGADPAWLGAITIALNEGLTPEFGVLGGIGTTDLTAMAATALTMIGERAWRGGLTQAVLPTAIADATALSFMSSNALTLGHTALLHQDLASLLDAELQVAALSHLAMSGSSQPYSESVQKARPHHGQRATAQRLRELLGPDIDRHAARVQDPYGLRALPQVHGPAVEALASLDRVLAVELNGATENPLVVADTGEVLHNGNFHGGYLAQALDSARLALCADASLSQARLSALVDPERTGLRPFLADGPAGSSGIMILEYTASAALAEMRSLAAPVSLGNVVLSRGAEEHAAFSPQAARAAAAMVPRFRTLLACELVAAVRAMRQRGVIPAGPQLRSLYDEALSHLPQDDTDRPLDADIATAERLITAQSRQT